MVQVVGVAAHDVPLQPSHSQTKLAPANPPRIQFACSFPVGWLRCRCGGSAVCCGGRTAVVAGWTRRGHFLWPAIRGLPRPFRRARRSVSFQPPELLPIVPTSVTRARLSGARAIRRCSPTSLRTARGAGRTPSHAIDDTTEWVTVVGACATGGGAEENSLGVARSERATPRLSISRSTCVRS